MLTIDAHADRERFIRGFPNLIATIEEALEDPRLDAPQALQSRTRRWLKINGIFVLGQLAFYPEAELLRFKNIGWKSIRLMKEMLALYDLHLETRFSEEQRKAINSCAGILVNYLYSSLQDSNGDYTELLMRDRDADLSREEAYKMIKLVEKWGWVKTRIPVSFFLEYKRP